MADFYPVLADAVARLRRNDPEARQDLYAHARTIFAERSRGPGARELASALEVAIGKVEAEARAKATAKSLASILEVLQPDAPRHSASPVSARAPLDAATAPAAKSPPGLIHTDNAWPVDPAAELGGMPNSLGTMLVGIAYVAAAVAFTGVTCLRGAVWLSEGLIGYPAMLAMIAITLALFVVSPLIVLRKISNLPAIAFLLRFIYSASRRTTA